MKISEAIYRNEKPHPVLVVGLVTGLLSLVLGSFGLLLLFLGCMAWWLHNDCKPNLLSRHNENARGEVIELGSAEIPLADCSMGAPDFSYFLHGLPQIRQRVTAKDPETGESRQYLLVTRFNGQTLLHPFVEN